MSRRKQLRPQHLWSGESEENQEGPTSTPTEDRLSEETESGNTESGNNTQSYITKHNKHTVINTVEEHCIVTDNKQQESVNLSDNTGKEHSNLSDNTGKEHSNLSDNTRKEQINLSDNTAEERTKLSDNTARVQANVKDTTVRENSHFKYNTRQRNVNLSDNTRQEYLNLGNNTKEKDKTNCDNTRHQYVLSTNGDIRLQKVDNDDYDVKRKSQEVFLSHDRTTLHKVDDHVKRKSEEVFLLNEHTGELHGGASHTNNYHVSKCLSTSLVCDSLDTHCYAPVFNHNNNNTTTATTSIPKTQPVISSTSSQISNTSTTTTTTTTTTQLQPNQHCNKQTVKPICDNNNTSLHQWSPSVSSTARDVEGIISRHCAARDLYGVVVEPHSQDQPVNTSAIALNPADYYTTTPPSGGGGSSGDFNDKRYLSTKLREKNEIFKRIRRHSAATGESRQVQPVGEVQRYRTQSESTAVLQPIADSHRYRTDTNTAVLSSQRYRTNSESIARQSSADRLKLARNKSIESVSSSLSDLSSLSINTSGLLYPATGQITSPIGSFPWLSPLTSTIQGLSPGSHPSPSDVFPRYTCQVCGVVLRSLGELGMHIQEHAGEKLYKCELCEHSFETRQILAEHEIRDHHIKPRDNEQRKQYNSMQQQQTQQHVENDQRKAYNTQEHHADKTRFNFHSPWEEFTSTRRRHLESHQATTSRDDLVTADRASHDQHVTADRVSQDYHQSLSRRTSHDRRVSVDYDGETAPSSDKLSKYWNGDNSETDVTHTEKAIKPNGTHELGDTAKSRLSSDLDLSKSYRSTLSLDSSIGSDRLNSSGEASYHSSQQQSPITSPTTHPTDKLYSPLGYYGNEPTSGTSAGSYSNEPTGGTGSSSSNKGHNGIAEKDALNSLKNLTAKNFAFPSLPGFANAFGQHPWAAMAKYGQVNGLIPTVVGGTSRAAVMVGSYNQSSTNTSTASSLPFRGTLGKQTDSGLACSYCGKVCPRPSILKRHMMMHTGERPFECKVCGQRFRAKGSMLFHQKLRHNMDVKLNKALEERYLQIVANQKQKQMREERKKAALTSKDSTAWFQHEMQSWMLQSHLQSRVFAGNISSAATISHPSTSSVISGTSRISGHPSTRDSLEGTTTSQMLSDSDKLEAVASVDYSNNESETDGISKEIGKSPIHDFRNMETESVVVKKEDATHASPLEIQSDVNGNITAPGGQTENNNNDVNIKISSDASQSDLHKGHIPGHFHGDHNHKVTQGFTSTGELSTENLNRIRDMMFTPEPQPIESMPGFDDSCNLKENLDRLIMKAFSKLGIENCNMDLSPTDGNGQEGQSHNSSQGNSANSSISISPDSQTGRRQSDGSGTTGRGGGSFNIEYPSVFPGLKHQMNIRNETVIVTRLDGINTSTGHKVSLYKCYLCGRIFHQLSLLQCHLSTHFEKYMTFYECLYCDAHFKFKTQLLQHMNTTHNVNYALTDIPDTPSVTAMVTTPSDHPSQEDDTSQGHNPADLAEFEGQTPSLLAEDHTSSTPLSHKGKFHSGITLKKINGLYVCRFCNKTFDRSFSVIRHERMHTGYKPCICRHCGRGFSEPRNLRQHMKRFHNPLHNQSGTLGNKRPKRRSSSNIDESELLSKRTSPLQESYLYTQGNRDDLSTAPPGGHDHDDLEKENFSRADEERTESPENESGISEISSSKLDSSNEMANEIREKERLGDDITVVIPSDAPLEGRERSVDTPRSINSENTTWSNISEVEGDAGGEIITAPVRSIIGSHPYKIPKRRPSYPGGGGSSDTYPGVGGSGGEGNSYHEGTNYSGGGGEGTMTPTPITVTPISQHESHDAPASSVGETRVLKSPASSISEHNTHDSEPDFKPPTFMTAEPATSTATSTPQGAAPSGMTPYGPLSVSTFLNPAGLPGLIPSPLMSPAQQAAFFAQAGLTSPTVMGGVLPFMTPFHAHAGGTLGGASAAGSKDQTPSSDASSTGTYSSSSKMEDLRGDYMSQLGKGSSLSRTHSRLYVVRNPIKREEACKPTVLSDGRTVYRCSYCNKDFATYSDINRHMDFHEGKTDIRPYKCKYCDYYARTNSQLKVHMMRHQGIREFHCKLCNYKGVTQSDLNRHMKSQIHMMKAQNECRHCGEGFVSPKNLERHIEEKHYHSPHQGHETVGGTGRHSTSSTSTGSHHSMVGFQAPLPR